MNTQQQINVTARIDAAAVWLLGAVGRLVQFLGERQAGIHAGPAWVRVRVARGGARPMPAARVSRNRLNSSVFRHH